jgi:endoglucanase
MAVGLHGLAAGARADDGPRVALAFDKPFLFTYGTWEKAAKVVDGRAVLRGEGMNARGGGGWNVALDLSKQADASPALRLRVGPRNTLPTLQLLVRDTDERTAKWFFPLPQAGGAEAVVVTPRDGEPWSAPETIEPAGSTLDLKRITQVQLGGDWSEGRVVDVEVEALLVAPPTAAMLEQRKAIVAKAEAARAKASREQDQLRAKYGTRGPNSPTVEAVGLVAPDVIGLTIHAGRVSPGSLAPYRAEEGDKRDEKKNKEGQVESVILVRQGREIGWLIGPKRDQLVRFETFEGDPLLEFLADDPATFTVTSKDDPNFAAPGRKPVSVSRKSKPFDWAQPPRGLAMRHRVYLRMNTPLKPGATYTIDLGGLNTAKADVSLAFDPARVPSEAVHAQQVGYRPDDPVKEAFLSCWAGAGGGVTYPDNLMFRVVDQATGRAAFEGEVAPHWPASKPEQMANTENFVMADVLRMDFSGLDRPGTYRVVVDGVGCSPPFEIGAKSWDHAFRVQMSGLYNERSGVELGPPYTSFRKPRDFHPADGVRVTRSTHAAMDGGGEAFAKLAAGDTGEPVPDAWGGWHDAGDWNPRRVTHMKAVLAILELYELFPEHFRAVDLNIPPDGRVPDVLAECLFELDCFRRLQREDGGMPYGIETAGDPIEGEVSWLQSMPAYVFAPDPAASWYYAAVAARAGRIVEPFDAARARDYRDSAARAMRWAEADLKRRESDGRAKTVPWTARDSRNLAALELYRATGDPSWNELFRVTSCLGSGEAPELFAWGDHVQVDAAFAYTCLDPSKADATWQKRARAGILRQAEKALDYAAGNAFGITTPDRNKPQFIGFYTTPDAIELARAHVLTGDRKYLAGAVRACGFSLGANPDNLVYTTGLGSNPVRNPLFLDSRRTGQPAPPGLTVYGPIDYKRWNDQGITWPITYFLGAACTPNPFAWPTPEAHFDIFLYPMITEFTVDIWASNLYVWGYLSARE